MYASVVTTVPATSARGRFRCGSRTSSAVNVTVFHASYAKSALDIATPIAAKRPISAPFAPSCVPRSGVKCDIEPLPLPKPDDHEQRDGAHLEHREHVLHERALAHAARVDPREHAR